ncbi:sensor histidine kinase [Clostridia bacterium]|nr:sensor histidine kinase [Clostridia bacterium]
MRKRIFWSTLALTSACIAAVALCLCAVFYFRASDSTMKYIREQTETLRDVLESAPGVYAGIRASDTQVTIVAADGTVIYDNGQAAPGTENLAGRKEISEAMSTGYGESAGLSGDGRETLYYAVRLADGSILRLSRAADGLWDIFEEGLPVAAAAIFLAAIFGYALAGRLTGRIVRPLNELSFEPGAVPLYDELSPFLRAMSEQRERIAEQLSELQNRSDTINALMSNAREGIAFVGGRGEILSVNRSALAIFGARGKMTGKSILELLRDVELTGSIRAALEGTGGEVVYERSGKTYQVLFSPVPRTAAPRNGTSAENSGHGAMIFFFDITEKVKAEKMRREFSANVSHELKTPLTSISGYAEMITGGVARQEDVAGFAAKIRDEAARLIALIEDIIMLSELDETAVSRPAAETDLAELAREVRDALALKAAESEVTVELELTEARIAGSQPMLFEMLYNLVDNGINYNHPGGRVTVAVRQTGGTTEVLVSDTGIGVPEEHRERVFERFYRVDKSRSKKTGGTGLGLSIVKNVALSHGGSVEMSGGENGGTTVTVRFS